MAGARQEILDWLGLRLIPGVGSVTFDRLRRAFGSPGAVLSAPLKALCAVAGLKEEVAVAVHGKAFGARPERELERLEALGGRVVTLLDPEYPPLLSRIYAPPPLLFVRGDLAGCRPGGVALVGSRDMTPYGRRVAEDLARDLARAGVSVISGLARGVDTVAHQAALAAGGHSVGVLGAGLNIIYPPENARLTTALAQKGAVISEFPLGTRPLAGNFPVRNRLISGLSRAVVVVEAGIKSGSLITARHALDQNREVLAVPGPVGTPQSQGCHELIRQGARLLTSAQDLLAPGALPPLLEQAAQAPADPPELPAPAAELLALLGPAPVHVDLLVRESGLKPQEVTALLVNLEMAGLVDQRPGKHYIRS
ncbi:MAG: DNA-processing protein DprA [Pseudomonadota bacterium]